MTKRTARRLRDLRETTRKYWPVVEKELSKITGDHAKEAFLESAAKYYPALKKLASK
jgi:hypothetical protein